MENLNRDAAADGISRSGARPKALRRLGVPVVALSLAVGAGQVVAASSSQAAGAGGAQGRVTVGHAPSLPKGAVVAAAPSASTQLSIDVQLNTGHGGDLAAYAKAVSDRTSVYYHRYLTTAQVAEYFGAPASEISAVQSDLKAQGLTAGSVSSDGMFLSVSGSVAQVEKAFGTKIAGYRSAGRTIYANTTAPSVDASIAPDVSGIVGLDDIGYAKPQSTVATHMAKSDSSAVTSKVSARYAVSGCQDIINAWNNYDAVNHVNLQNGSGYYTDDALSRIYGLAPLVNAGNDGAGVTVAVFELEGYDPTGVSQIDSCYGHSTSVSMVRVDGGPTIPANSYNNVGLESALDIENIANLAPGVKIIDYAGPDNANDTQLLDTYSKIVNDDKAQVVSTSWGLCETLADSPVITGENTLFQQAAVQGQTVFAAAGDNGSSDCYGATLSDGSMDTSNALAVDDPASQPYVTGAGGTNMTGLTNPAPSVWNDGCTASQGTLFCSAGGGGVSSQWQLPSWQAGTTGASGYSATCTTAATTGCREVPDVSALASGKDGYVIKEYYNDGTPADTGYVYWIMQGTSGAAPVWAAVTALADATTTCRLNGEAGFINPSLYAAGSSASASSVFTDVTSGSNYLSALGGPNAYNAGVGYDLASGWGTPKAAGVAAQVCQAPISSPGSYYQADGPIRLLDTRSGPQHVGSYTGPVPASQTVKLPIVGNSLLTGTSAVPSGATAAVLNVTETAPTVGGNATVYPDGEKEPLTSNLNWNAGQTSPNLVVVPLKSDGAVDITNNSGGTVQFIADLEGYFTSATTVNSVTSSRYVPLAPIRAMDTRHGGNGVAKAKLAAQKTISLQVGGTTITAIGGTATQAIPAGITGVAMNVTVTNVTGGGHLTVYPNQTSSGSAVPTPNVSNLNFSAGQTVPNMVMVPVGKDGKVDFLNGSVSGSLDVIADIAGYYTAGGSGEIYHPLGPVRLVDTRIGEGTTSVAPIAAQGTLNLALPSSYKAIIANLTVTQPAAGGYLNAYPLGGVRPNVSNLNFSTGQTIPNLAIVQSNSGVAFYNAAGSVHLIVDLAGYFSAS